MKAKTGTRFLNVDLDVVADRPLDEIAKAFGERVLVLHCGRWGPKYSVDVEMADSGYRNNPLTLVRRLVALVNDLPPAAKRLWEQARSREFNIGIEAASRSSLYELRLPPEILKEVIGVNGTILISVYAPQRVSSTTASKGKKVTRKSSNQAL